MIEKEAPRKHPALEEVDLTEKGARGKDGIQQTSTRRLFVQLQVFTGCQDIESIKKVLETSSLNIVLYQDANDPYGIGVLTLTENPDDFVGELRKILQDPSFQKLKHIDEMTMLGRTYGLGREPNLQDWLTEKPKRSAMNPATPWAVWYPLRRKPEFELLPKEEQGKILMEHGLIGRSYGDRGYATDVRLACHGLDKHDNEYVIGLIGAELFPLSHLIQRMRRTQQTAKYLQSLGPFFIGKAYWQSPIR